MGAGCVLASALGLLVARGRDEGLVLRLEVRRPDDVRARLPSGGGREKGPEVSVPRGGGQRGPGRFAGRSWRRRASLGRLGADRLAGDLHRRRRRTKHIMLGSRLQMHLAKILGGLRRGRGHRTNLCTTRTRPPIKYWLSTLPPTATRADLVRLAMLRWRIERDYQELKDELGLDHFEGRGWRGFHHHATLCIAAYAFLAAERLAHFPPEPRSFLQAPRVPTRFTPRGAPSAS